MAEAGINEQAGSGDHTRREAHRLVRGAGSYVDDLHLPNMAHAVFVRSSVAHGIIKGIDLSAARRLPGVLAVFAHSDIVGKLAPHRPRRGPLQNLALYPLAQDKVRYVGEPVAVVVAENSYQAQDAADAVVVDYDPLPVNVDSEEALRAEGSSVYEEFPSNLVAEIHIATDRVDQAFAQADHVISDRLRTQRIAPCPLEPRASLGTFDVSSGQYTLWSTTANIHGVRQLVAGVLRVGENQLRVIAPDVGGSFGGKVSPYPEDMLVPFLAKELNRPVKWVETRIEHMTNVKQGRDQIHDLEAAVRSDGRILALRDKIVADFGASFTPSNAFSAAALYVTGPYDIQCYKVDAFGVATNKTPQGPVRGIGKSDAAYAVERFVDIIASRLGMDPVEVRMKNFVSEDAFPYRTATGAVLDSGRYSTCLRKALDLAGYEELRKHQTELRGKGVLRGIGTSLVIEPTSAARRGQGGGYSSCRVRMEPSGRISAFPSHGAQGQGHETTIARIIADCLSLAPDDVEVFAGDSTSSPYGSSATSSRTAVTLMPAVHVAATRLRDKILQIASQVLEINSSDLRLENGTIRAMGAPDRALSLLDVTRIAYTDIFQLPSGVEPGLEIIGTFVAPNIVWEHDEKGRRNEFAAVPYDATVAVVDVDRTTGAVRIVKYVSVHDCGTRLVPEIVETQHYGCIAQGVGEALYEELRYDEDGRPLNSTFMDYLIPSVNDVPAVEIGELVTPSPFTPLGAKGGGETGTLSPPAALGNAIEDALKPLGVKARQRPYSPDRIWKILHGGE